MAEPERLDTGTGAARRRLTTDEAHRGAVPETMTREEWRAMAETVAVMDDEMARARALRAEQIRGRRTL